MKLGGSPGFNSFGPILDDAGKPVGVYWQIYTNCLVAREDRVPFAEIASAPTSEELFAKVRAHLNSTGIHVDENYRSEAMSRESKERSYDTMFDYDQASISGRIDGLQIALNILSNCKSLKEAEERIEAHRQDLMR